MKTIESINLIWRRPGCRRGRPTIIGRGLKVKRIVSDYLFDEGNPSPEQIAGRYVATPAQVFAALAYYHLHKVEIDDDIAEDSRFDELLQSKGPKVAFASMAVREEPEASSIESLALISRDTDLHYGSPCIDGTRVRVADVVVERRFGKKAPEDIADKYDLTPAQVFCALAYYHERRDGIDAEIEYESRFDERWKAEGLVPTEAALLSG